VSSIVPCPTIQAVTTATFTCTEACDGVIYVDYGGQIYYTVAIGEQCWLKTNLNIGTRINGSVAQTDNGVLEKYCYNDVIANCDVYGGLYMWDEAMQYSVTPGTQGICPSGWHIPTDNEWSVMSNYLGGTMLSGGALKESGTTHWLTPNTGATNSSLFTALPGGGRILEGWNWIYIANRLWSSNSTRHYETLSYDNTILQDYGEGKSSDGFSVRCIKD